MFPYYTLLALINLLKANILIDQDGTPRLTDFGLSWIYEDATIWETSRKESPGTTRYMSPELLSGATNFGSEESDIYAYAMTSWVKHIYLPDVKILTVFLIQGNCYW